MRKQIVCTLLLTVLCSTLFLGCFESSKNTGSKCAEVLDAYFASKIHLDHQKLQATKFDLSDVQGYLDNGSRLREKFRLNPAEDDKIKNKLMDKLDKGLGNYWNLQKEQVETIVDKILRAQKKINWEITTEKFGDEKAKIDGMGGMGEEVYKIQAKVKMNIIDQKSFQEAFTKEVEQGVNAYIEQDRVNKQFYVGYDAEKVIFSEIVYNSLLKVLDNPPMKNQVFYSIFFESDEKGKENVIFEDSNNHAAGLLKDLKNQNFVDYHSMMGIANNFIYDPIPYFSYDPEGKSWGDLSKYLSNLPIKPVGEHWIKDNKTNAYLWDDKPLKDETVTWSGEVVQYGDYCYANGPGTAKWYQKGKLIQIVEETLVYGIPEREMIVKDSNGQWQGVGVPLSKQAYYEKLHSKDKS